MKGFLNFGIFLSSMEHLLMSTSHLLTPIMDSKFYGIFTFYFCRCFFIINYFLLECFLFAFLDLTYVHSFPRSHKSTPCKLTDLFHAP